METEEEKVSKINKENREKFQELILLNRIRGRDHEVLQDYLEARDAKLNSCGLHYTGIYSYLKEHRSNYLVSNHLFSNLERKVKERLEKSSPIDLERRYGLAQEIIQEWVDKQGQDRCWYYPDLFNRLVLVFNIKNSKDASLPLRKYFEEGCKKYQDEQYKTC